MAPAGIDRKKNPLAFVDRLLDDERDSNLHLGDVRFWRHIEYIDTVQIYRLVSLEYRTMKLMFCEALFYIIFLTTLTLYIAEVRPSTVYEARRQQLDYWGGCRRGSIAVDPMGGGACRYEEVHDRQSLMEWLKDDFTPKAFTAKDLVPSNVEAASIFRLQKGAVPWSPRFVGDTEAVILTGAIRLRQLRVQYNVGCSVKDIFKEIHPDCFPAFTESVQSRLPWAPSWTPEHLTFHFEYSTGNRSLMTPIEGEHGMYPADGFYFDLPNNLTGAQMRLLELQEWKWFDDRTRAVVIEFSTLSPNVNIFVHQRFLFEFPATGGVVQRHEATAVRVSQLSLSLLVTDDVAAFALLVITCALHLLLLFYVIFLLVKNGLGFFKYLWSVCDVAILVLFCVQVTVDFSIFAETAGSPGFAPEVIADPEMFFPIGHVVPKIHLSASLLAVIGAISWLKILKYFTLWSTFRAFVRVVERCLYNLVLFGVLMVVVLFGFAVAFYIGYGGERDLFSTLLGSFVACVIAPVGGVSFEPIFAANDAVGPLLVIAYFVLIFLLLTNTFLAICVDTYSVCTYQMNEVKRITKADPATVFLWTYINALGSVKLVGKETEDDKGGPQEQQIALSALPEAIASRYIATKRRMEAIIEDTKAEQSKQLEDAAQSAGLKMSTTPQQPLKAKLKDSNEEMLALKDDPERPRLSTMLSRQGGSHGLSLQNLPEDAIHICTERGKCDGTLEVYHGEPLGHAVSVPPGGRELVWPLYLDDNGFVYWQDDVTSQRTDNYYDKIRPTGNSGYQVNCVVVRRGPGRQFTWDFFHLPGSEHDGQARNDGNNVENLVVKRVQLQRMLDDDEVLQDICGRDAEGRARAIDVIRRFQVNNTGVDPYDAVAQLQASVTKKLQEIEAGEKRLEFDEVEMLQTVSSELHSALTEAQKEWRGELLSVLQMATLLSRSLVQLTHNMEAVHSNHNELSNFLRAAA